MTKQLFAPTRTAALERLQSFVPKAGAYASKRNYDISGHPHVSVLSPYIRHRVLTEVEVLQAVLGRYAPSTVEKYVQEVFWRTYWKGWLEMRPSVWSDYKQAVHSSWNDVQTQSGMRSEWEAACKGETGIDCFDHWAKELVQTGYLHNHARMWFASIWIFTLRLPWALGADFFLRHLLDGDPASNTLSWRWVGGLHTKGKTYLARPDNIAKYTEGRFRPTGLATHAEPLTGMPNPERSPLPEAGELITGARTGLLITEDDTSIGWIVDQVTPVATACLNASAHRSPLHVAPSVHSFTQDLISDGAARYSERIGTQAGFIDAEQLAQWANEQGLDQVVTSYVPVGPARDALKPAQRALSDKGITLTQLRRPYDTAAWPHATHGFFRFKDKIPSLLGRIRGVRLADSQT
ncbi:FAD-binding domain-containing protein [Nereida sp. MMG025]|uniref:FAD-binding domain-containing protein n=1 Tax=Nereida sp. MMG025 TaxID=2909981 RepID=UPI001F3051BD|nr:FAD-binding domain-containing protein [Nereida sp. MMG025]MCF6443729.1 DNA photolyase [Nereida sp. MMG025]